MPDEYNTDDRSRIASFWQWFVANKKDIELESTDAKLIAELESHLSAIDNRLEWEIGPGADSPWQIVISAGGNESVAVISKETIDNAPMLTNWAILEHRPPKKWDHRVEVNSEGRELSIDVSSWTYVLLAYTDLSYDIILSTEDSAIPNGVDLAEIARIAVEAEIGEYALVSHIGDLEIVQKMMDEYEEKKSSIIVLGSHWRGMSIS